MDNRIELLYLIAEELLSCSYLKLFNIAMDLKLVGPDDVDIIKENIENMLWEYGMKNEFNLADLTLAVESRGDYQ